MKQRIYLNEGWDYPRHFEKVEKVLDLLSDDYGLTSTFDVDVHGDFLSDWFDEGEADYNIVFASKSNSDEEDAYDFNNIEAIEFADAEDVTLSMLNDLKDIIGFKDINFGFVNYYKSDRPFRIEFEY